MKRSDLKKLIDAAPESELPTIGSFISFVIDQSQRKELLLEPPDDVKARIQLGLDQIERGEGIPHEEIEAMIEEWLRE